MFGKIASEALGLSDIGRVIKKENYDKVESDDYIMTENGEQIYFLIKSKKDEYCFTNFALIHLDGDSAISKKRLLKRYDYSKNDIKHVLLETAGTIDLDVELKFYIGDVKFSIDCHKENLEQIKDIYKTLIEISSLMRQEQVELSVVERSLELTSNSLARNNSQQSILDQSKALYSFFQETLEQATKEANRKDYSQVFEKFIHN